MSKSQIQNGTIYRASVGSVGNCVLSMEVEVVPASATTKAVKLPMLLSVEHMPGNTMAEKRFNFQAIRKGMMFEVEVIDNMRALVSAANSSGLKTILARTANARLREVVLDSIEIGQQIAGRVAVKGTDYVLVEMPTPFPANTLMPVYGILHANEACGGLDRVDKLQVRDIVVVEIFYIVKRDKQGQHRIKLTEWPVVKRQRINALNRLTNGSEIYQAWLLNEEDDNVVVDFLVALGDAGKVAFQGRLSLLGLDESVLSQLRQHNPVTVRIFHADYDQVLVTVVAPDDQLLAATEPNQPVNTITTVATELVLSSNPHSNSDLTNGDATNNTADLEFASGSAGEPARPDLLSALAAMASLAPDGDELLADRQRSMALAAAEIARIHPALPGALLTMMAALDMPGPAAKRFIAAQLPTIGNSKGGAHFMGLKSKGAITAFLEGTIEILRSTTAS